MKILDFFSKDEVKTITDNFTLIIAIPYVIGGLSQFMQLTDISIDLVKFFSLTQLLIDGLLILAKCATLYFITYSISGYISAIKNRSEKKYAIFGISILALCFASGCVMAYNIFTHGDFIIVKWSMRLFLFFFILLFSFVNSNKFSVIGTIIFILITTSLLTKVFKDDNKIQNISVLTNNLKKTYPEVELSYYNDQFLFYETSRDKENNRIIIKKIDELFEASN